MRKAYFLILSSIVVTLFSTSVLAEEIKVLSPQKTHFPGQTVVFQIQAVGFFQPKEVLVYYRYIGSKKYLKLPLRKETEIDYVGQIPGERIIPPGIEYFVRIVNGKGAVFTLPEVEPVKNPFKLPVTLDRSPPAVESVAPSEGESVSDRRPEIRVVYKDTESRVDPSTVRIFLDRTDVTAKSRISENSLSFRPDSDLSYGTHTVTVFLSDYYGNRAPPKTWSFKVSQTKFFDRADVSLTLEGEGRTKILEKKSSTTPDWSVFSHGKVDTKFEKESFSFTFTSDLWYREEEGPGPQDDRFTLTNFLAEASFGKFHAKAGDLSLTLTELSGGGLARRGISAGVKDGDYEAELFSVRSNYVTGFRGGIAPWDPGQRILGGKAKGVLIKPLNLSLSLLFLSGRNEHPGGAGVSTTEAANEGDLFSVGLEGGIKGESLTFSSEYSTSSFDEDIASGPGKERDSAWRVKLGSRGSGYDISAGVKYLGPEFASIVNSAAVKDRIEYTFTWGLQGEPGSLRFTGTHYEDNVDRDPSVPVIRNRTGSISLNVRPWQTATLTAGYSLTAQDSIREPAGYNPLKTVTHLLNGGFSITGQKFTFSQFYSYSRVNDRNPSTNGDSESHTLTVSTSYRPTETVSLTPTFTYTNTRPRSTGLTSETLQGAFSGNLTFFENKGSLNATLSWVDSNSSEGLAHTVTWSGIGQVNFRIEDYLFHAGTQTLSLRGQYSENDDRVTGKTTRDYSVYLVVSFGIPVQIAGGPEEGGM